MRVGPCKTVALRSMWTMGASSRGLNGNNIINQARDNSCDIWERMAAFCPCYMNLPEAKLNFGIILLAKKFQDSMILTLSHS